VILGVSHITLGCADLDAGIRNVAELGYRAEFTERELPSNPAKAKFLSAPWTMHAIAFTRAAHGLPIELVSYAATLPREPGRYVGYFSQSAPQRAGTGAELAAYTSVAGKALGTSAATASALPGFGVLACYEGAAENDTRGLTAAVLSVANLQRAQQFWCAGLGFRKKKPVGESHGWTRLDFQSPVAAWRLTLVLASTDDVTIAPYLDGCGMTCLSFICSKIEDDRRRVLDAGSTDSTGPFESRVNGKTLCVEVFHGLHGEYIELIQILM
jgi:hypothetical protein